MSPTGWRPNLGQIDCNKLCEPGGGVDEPVIPAWDDGDEERQPPPVLQHPLLPQQLHEDGRHQHGDQPPADGPQGLPHPERKGVPVNWRPPPPLEEFPFKGISKTWGEVG